MHILKKANTKLNHSQNNSMMWLFTKKLRERHLIDQPTTRHYLDSIIMLLSIYLVIKSFIPVIVLSSDRVQHTCELLLILCEKDANLDEDLFD